MSKKLLAAVLLSATLGGMAFGAEFTPDARLATSAQAKELLAQGVKEFRVGRHQQAAAAFSAALKLEPGNQLLFQFYLAAGDGLLMKMMEYDELDGVLKDLLVKARIHQKSLRQDPAYLALLIEKLRASEEERVAATLELVAVGPIAVPPLVAALSDNRQDDLRSLTRVVLTKMGYRAVVPLIECLKSKDQRQVTSVLAVLADIGDARALPQAAHLAAAAGEETTKRVAVNTIEAIRKANRMAAVPTAEQLYFNEALRYFRAGDLVRDEMVANESLMWQWQDDAAAGQQLTYKRVPRYAWNELMAEEIVFQGIALFPENASYHPILTAVYAAEAVETTLRIRLAKESTIPLADQRPDEQLDAIAMRVSALAEVGNRVKMAGAVNLYRAVQQSIVSERADVAAYLMRTLEDRALARADSHLPTKAEGLAPEKAGSALVAALDHPDKLIRYQAAITLAHLDPAVEFFNAEKVVPILADAVGEWGMRVVMLVDQDYRNRNSGREALQNKGMMAYTAADGFEAVQRLEEAPIKDAIVIAGDLLPSLKDEHGALIKVPEQQAVTLVEKLATDPRSAKTPVFISLPEDPELANKIQKAIEGKGNVKGFVKRPFTADDLAGQIELALKDAEQPNVNREAAEDVALRAALALQAPNPMRTQFDLGAAAEKLAATLDARVDALRIEACKALGVASMGPSAATVKGHLAKAAAVYGAQDAQLKPGTRAAFLGLFGMLDPADAAVAPFLASGLKFADENDATGALQVRTAAAEAVGYGTVPAAQLGALQQQQRLNVRDQGATAVAAATPAAAAVVPADAPAAQ